MKLSKAQGEGWTSSAYKTRLCTAQKKSRRRVKDLKTDIFLFYKKIEKAAGSSKQSDAT